MKPPLNCTVTECVHMHVCKHFYLEDTGITLHVAQGRAWFPAFTCNNTKGSGQNMMFLNQHNV